MPERKVQWTGPLLCHDSTSDRQEGQLAWSAQLSSSNNINGHLLCLRHPPGQGKEKDGSELPPLHNPYRDERVPRATLLRWFKDVGQQRFLPRRGGNTAERGRSRSTPRGGGGTDPSLLFGKSLPLGCSTPRRTTHPRREVAPRGRAGTSRATPPEHTLAAARGPVREALGCQPTTSFLTATTSKYATCAGITAAAGTRLAHKWMLTAFLGSSFIPPPTVERPMMVPLLVAASPMHIDIEQFARLLPTLVVVAVFQAPSPESNPHSALPVIATVVHRTAMQG